MPDPGERDPYEEASRAHKRGDHARAAEIYEELAREGDVHGLVVLGSLYAHGRGVPVDLNKAEQLYNRAARVGSVEAVFQLANIWHDRGDMHRYFLSIEEAAGKGLLVAQFFLGLCYKRGRGTAVDAARAEELIRDAADRGLIRAKSYLARQRIFRIYNPVGFVHGLFSMMLVIFEGLTLTLIDSHDERLR